MRSAKLLFCFILVGLISACGGGGGSTNASVPNASVASSIAASAIASVSSTSPSSAAVSSSVPNSSVASSIAASAIASVSSTSPSSAAVSSSASSSPVKCTSPTADSDGDGMGVENGQACVVTVHTAFEITGAMGAGWNLGNSLDAFGCTGLTKGEICWGNPKTTKAMIDAIKSAGFKTLRVPVTWDENLSGADHLIASVWLDRVEEVVNYGLDNNMYVIVNIHHNTGWETPTYANEINATDYLTKIWQQIAARFNKYSDHLIFETMNEPRNPAGNGAGDTDGWWGIQENFDVVNRLNAAALNVIRASGGNNAKRLVMLPGYVAGSNAHQVDAIVLPNDSMIAVSTHAYTPYEFALHQTGTAIFVSTELDTTLAHLNVKFISKGIPVVLGEWASTHKNNLSERVKHAGYFVKEAKKINIPTVWWDNNSPTTTTGDAMGLYNRAQNTWYYPEIRDAIMQGLQ